MEIQLLCQLRIGCPPAIVNEEDHTVEEHEILDFRKWNIPKVDTKSVYKTSFVETTFYPIYKVINVEQTFYISRVHKKCCLFSKRNINELLQKNSVICILVWFKLLLSHSPERVLMLLF